MAMKFKNEEQVQIVAEVVLRAAGVPEDRVARLARALDLQVGDEFTRAQQEVDALRSEAPGLFPRQAASHGGQVASSGRTRGEELSGVERGRALARELTAKSTAATDGETNQSATTRFEEARARAIRKAIDQASTKA